MSAGEPEGVPGRCRSRATSSISGRGRVGRGPARPHEGARRRRPPPAGSRAALRSSRRTENREGIDRLAEVEDRDRSYLINKAVGSYLARKRWEGQHIKESLRQAKGGKFATDKQVETAYEAFGKSRGA